MSQSQHFMTFKNIPYKYSPPKDLVGITAFVVYTYRGIPNG